MLQERNFDEVLSGSLCFFKKNSNTDGFAKFWRTLLNSCFKEIADKGTTEWIERVTINL